MIIKFKNGYTVRVEDHEGVDKAEIIERALYLIHDVKIKDYDYVFKTSNGKQHSLRELSEIFSKKLALFKANGYYSSDTSNSLNKLFNLFSSVVKNATTDITKLDNSEKSLRIITDIINEFTKTGDIFSDLLNRIKDTDRATYNSFIKVEKDIDNLINQSEAIKKKLEQSFGLESNEATGNKLTYRGANGNVVNLTPDKIREAFTAFKDYDSSYDTHVESYLSMIANGLLINLRNNFNSVNFRNERNAQYKKDLIAASEEFVKQFDSTNIEQLEKGNRDLYNGLYRLRNIAQQFLNNNKINTTNTTEQPKAQPAQAEQPKAEENKVITPNKMSKREKLASDLKELRKLEKIRKENPESEAVKEQIIKLGKEIKKIAPAKKKPVKKDPNDIKEKEEMINFLLRNSINGLIAKGLTPDPRDIEKANNLAKEIGKQVVKNSRTDKYEMIKNNYDSLPEDYFNNALKGYNLEQANNDKMFAEQKNEKMNSNVLVEKVNELYFTLKEILSPVYDDIRKYVNDSDEHPIYNFGDHEGAVSVDKIKQFVLTVNKGIDAYRALVISYNQIFGKDVDPQFEERLKELDSMRGKIYYFIDGNRATL